MGTLWLFGEAQDFGSHTSVILALVAGIHSSTDADGRSQMDPGDKPRHDNG